MNRRAILLFKYEGLEGFSNRLLREGGKAEDKMREVRAGGVRTADAVAETHQHRQDDSLG
jgi:hypothetical protein